MCLDRVSASDDKRQAVANLQNVLHQPTVQDAEVHGAAGCPSSSSGKADSQTPRTVLLIKVRNAGHWLTSRSRLRNIVTSANWPSASTMRYMCMRGLARSRSMPSGLTRRRGAATARCREPVPRDRRGQQAACCGRAAPSPQGTRPGPGRTGCPSFEYGALRRACANHQRASCPCRVPQLDYGGPPAPTSAAPGLPRSRGERCLYSSQLDMSRSQFWFEHGRLPSVPFCPVTGNIWFNGLMLSALCDSLRHHAGGRSRSAPPQRAVSRSAAAASAASSRDTYAFVRGNVRSEV